MKYLKQILIGLGIIATFVAYMSFDYQAKAAPTDTIVNQLIVKSQAGTSGCAYFDATGYLLGGATCSGGGGGGSGGGWATSSTAFITTTYPNTTSAFVGINSSTPIGTLSVKGVAGSTAPFVVASSTNAILLQVNANGSTTISSLGAGFVKSTSAGSLYVGSAVTSVDMTVPTGLSISGNPITSSGTLALSLTSGYNIPLTASTTNWNGFYNTPSTRITAGSGLSWSGNTLSNVMASSTIIAGGTATYSPSITFATSSDTNLLLSIVCATSTCTFNPTWTGTLAAARLNSNVVQSVSTSTAGTVFTASISAQNLALVFPASPTFTTLTVTGQTTLGNASTSNLSVTTNAYLTNIASGNCLQTSTGGLITGTGSACGAGGSGNSAWLFGSGLIYNATTTDSVLVGTTTPTTAKLFVQGSGTKQPLVVASSTGTTLFTIDTFGSTTIANLAVANCDVKATTGGSLFCGTDATGASSGNAAWTIGNGLIYNATSTDLVGIGTITPTTTLYVQGKGGTNPFAIASSTGTQLLTVTQTGNVGIGTTTPSKLLEIFGDQSGGINRIKRDTGLGILTGTFYGTTDFMAYSATSTIDYPDLSGPVITFSIATNTMSNVIGDLGVRKDGVNTTGEMLLRAYQLGSVTDAAKFKMTGKAAGTSFTLTAASTTSAVLAVEAADGNDLLQANVSGVSVKAIGYPGVSQPFVVTSSTGASLLEVNSLPSSSTVWVQGSAGGNYAFGVGSSTPSIRLFDVLGDGRVGIATITPTATLAVQGTSTFPTRLVLNIASSSGSSYLAVLPSGNVGMGTTTPAYRLTVVGQAGNNPVLNVASSTGTSLLHVGANGRVGIGTTTPQSFFETYDASSTTQPSIVYVGGTTTPSTTKLGCLALYDKSASLYVYVKFVNGVFTTSTASSICQ